MRAETAVLSLSLYEKKAGWPVADWGSGGRGLGGLIIVLVRVWYLAGWPASFCTATWWLMFWCFGAWGLPLENGDWLTGN